MDPTSVHNTALSQSHRTNARVYIFSRGRSHILPPLPLVTGDTELMAWTGGKEKKKRRFCRALSASRYGHRRTREMPEKATVYSFMGAKKEQRGAERSRESAGAQRADGRRNLT